MRRIRFDLQGPGWTPDVLDSLAPILLEYADRFAASQTNVGHCMTVPFEIKVPQDTRHIASRPYRISPTLAAQVNPVIDP